MARVPCKARSGSFTNRRMMLRTVEKRAADIRSALRRRGRDSCSPGLMENAARLAGKIEALARFGQRASAADAAAIAELVELLLDDLTANIRSILVS